ncbi:MAG: HD domain-containing protein [Thermovirga sp.]
MDFPMNAKKLFILMISVLFALIVLHLGFSIAVGIRGDIRNIDSALALATGTISHVINEDLEDIDRLTASQQTLAGIMELLPESAFILDKDVASSFPSVSMPQHKNWRIVFPSHENEKLVLVRPVSTPEGERTFLGYAPDLSWADYLLPGIRGSELRLVSVSGEILWKYGGQSALEGKGPSRSDGGLISWIMSEQVFSRTTPAGPGFILVSTVIPVLPFLVSVLSKLPWTLGIELFLILGLFGVWLTFSRYLLTPLERVTRLALQMQDRLFTSLSTADLAEGVATLAEGIRDLTRESHLSEVKVFCQTLSSALQGYVFQHEKIADSGKELEKANMALSEANKGLLRRDEIWRKILDVSRTVTIESGFQKGLQRVSAILADISGAFGVVIGKIENDRMVVFAWSGFEEALEIHDVLLETSIIGKAVKAGSPIWVENIRSDPDYCQLHHKIKSELIIPMFHIGKAVGGLSIAWKDVRPENQALVELVMPVALHIAGLLDTQAAMLDLKNSYKYMAGRLQNLTAIYHDETAAHLERMEHYCRFLAVAMSRSLIEVDDVALFARLHDIGKLKVPVEILAKPAILDEAEFEIVKRHAAWGAEILGDASWLEMGRNICRYHHEKWDGSGYPEGLSAEKIPWEARIVALADIYDALRSSRSYKPALSHLETVRMILNGDGRVDPGHFDPSLLEVFKKFHHRMAEIYESISDNE